MTDSNTYIQHLHAFRGFAILNVVGAHAWSFMIFWTGGLTAPGLDWLFWSAETIFHGSTLYFAIISGILFTRILKGKSWKQFFQSKFTNVLLPYIVTTLLLTAYYWQLAVQNEAVNHTLTDYLTAASLNVLNGKADIHLWYIPVLLVMFTLTPLLAQLHTRSPAIVYLLALTPLLVSRSPFPDFLMPQSFIYFIGAYVLGMLLGEHYDRTKSFVARHKLMLITITLVTSGALFLLYVVNYQPGSVYSLRQTLVYVQKLTICLLVLYWLSEREAKLPHWLHTLGSYAFSIFFLHVIFIGLVISAVQPLLEESRTLAFITLFGGANFLAAIIGSLLVAKVVKLIFGRHARKLIGA